MSFFYYSEGETVHILTGISGYNPPKFALDAAKEALDRVECNQYSPTKVYTEPRNERFTC